MTLHLLIENLTNPALLFFILGIIAVLVKSDLQIPEGSSRFISIYLLFSIGFKGGQELSHESIDWSIAASLGFGMALSILVPLYTFFILKTRFGTADSGAIAASYGSVSAVTFVTAIGFLEYFKLKVPGHMVAVMALMESPAIVAGLILISIFETGNETRISKRSAILHSFTNGSVLLILGSLIIGMLTNSKQAEGIKPFTNDLFKGFLAIFLLDMGISSGRKLKSLLDTGIFPIAFAILIPLINGTLAAWGSSIVTDDTSTRFLFAILAASASYIAVPAAMKIAVPKANPGLYLPMALAITFPVNITIGMPIYYHIAGLS